MAKKIELTKELKDRIAQNSKDKTVTQWVSIGTVKPNYFNRNKMGALEFEALKKNMANPEVAFTDPIKVRNNPDKSPDAPLYEIIDGEHRWRAANELGYTEIPVFVRGEISDEKLIYEMIEANSVRGETTDADLRDLITTLERADDPFIQGILANDDTLWETLAVETPSNAELEKLNDELDKSLDDEDGTTAIKGRRVTLFLSEDQLDLYYRLIGQLRKAHGYTEEDAVMEIFEHFAASTGFGDKTGDERIDGETADLYDEDGINERDEDTYGTNPYDEDE